MQQSQAPTPFLIPFGNSATVGVYKRTIPLPSQIGVTNGAASLTDGFPPSTFVVPSAGGAGVDGRDMNGILFEITQQLQWLMAGGPVFFNGSLSGSIGGYPKQAVLSALGIPGGFWVSLADNNTNNPDAGQTTNWGFFDVFNTSITTGHHEWRPTVEILVGFVRANFLTIGNASSNGSERANGDTINLFTWIWVNFTDAQCPMYTSLGVLQPRGASAALDFAANYAMSTPDMRGQWPAGLDTMGNTSAARLATATFSIGSGAVPGSKGNFNNPGAGSNSASFQTGTWYIKLAIAGLMQLALWGTMFAEKLSALC